MPPGRCRCSRIALGQAGFLEQFLVTDETIADEQHIIDDGAFENLKRDDDTLGRDVLVHAHIVELVRGIQPPQILLDQLRVIIPVLAALDVAPDFELGAPFCCR